MVSSVVRCHHPWTAAVPWGKPCCSGNWGKHSHGKGALCSLVKCPLPFSTASSIPFSAADWLLPIPLLSYWSWCLVRPLQNTEGTWAFLELCVTEINGSILPTHQTPAPLQTTILLHKSVQIQDHHGLLISLALKSTYWSSQGKDQSVQVLEHRLLYL